MSSIIQAATTWLTNAHMIEDCAKIGYLRQEWLTLDPTYGRGRWWTRWKPDCLVAHDQKIDGSDFRNLDYKDGTFDAIAYDPPYISVGGRSSSNIKGMYEAYGVLNGPSTPKGIQELINDGLIEMYRLVKPKGIVLVKCQSYISSGKYWPGAKYTWDHALDLGFETVDVWHHIAGLRPQPHKTQKHARNNYSTLYVFTK